MKLENKSPRDYMYAENGKVAIFKKETVITVADDVAEKLLKLPDIVEVVDKEDVEKLKAELAELKAEKTLSRQEMLKIAEEKGLKFPKNISNAKLAELIK